MAIYIKDKDGTRKFVAGAISGKSAYEYAVEGGYTGTEAEFQTVLAAGPWLPLSGGVMTGKITGVVTPTEGADAANKAYVDGLVGEVAGALDDINGEVA